MPLRFGGLDLVSLDQEDTPNPGGSPVCLCPSQLRVGFKVSFWEPVRRVDVVRRPFCMTSLGGIELNPGFDAPRGSRFSQDSTATSSFYQVHWYVDPIIFWLEAIFDNACLEQSSFDEMTCTRIVLRDARAVLGNAVMNFDVHGCSRFMDIYSYCGSSIALLCCSAISVFHRFFASFA